MNERVKPNPQGYYACTKFKGEELIEQYAKKYKFKYGILRYFNVAGASNFIKNITNQSLKKKPIINIFGIDYPTKDRACVRDYIHFSDLADKHI